MKFLREQKIFSVEDYMTPEGYFGSWHGFDNPWPEKHDYFFNFSHHEPVMEETHEMAGHHLWYELATTLRGVGHHMLMVLGKVKFMKLFRDRANQLGDHIGDKN